MSEQSARRVTWRGNVQGVGFRASVRRAAVRAGVRGWVRNRIDGSVEALLFGPIGNVEEAVRAIAVEWTGFILSTESRPEPPPTDSGAFAIVETA